MSPQLLVLLTVPVDSDVLDWYRSRGRVYQTQINALLRAYTEDYKAEARAKYAARPLP
jgi:uncharacterized protein (DUF4415 family)